MALTTLELKKQLDQMFSGSQWKTSFKRDQDKYRVEWRETGKGVNITLPNVIAKHKQQGDKAIKELRSEEHTSELQSRGHLVCRLLLEKKKKKMQTTNAGARKDDTHK